LLNIIFVIIYSLICYIKINFGLIYYQVNVMLTLA